MLQNQLPPNKVLYMICSYNIYTTTSSVQKWKPTRFQKELWLVVFDQIHAILDLEKF